MTYLGNWDTNAAQGQAPTAPALTLATIREFINSQDFGRLDWQLRARFINALTMAAGLAPQYLLRV